MEVGTQREVSPLLEGAHCALVAYAGAEGGSWGCSLEGGKMGWVGADWEEGKRLGAEGLEAGGLDVDSGGAGGTAGRTKGAWARRRELRSSSWTADSEIPLRTCTNWTWTFP